ncbi:MAG: YicC/YloC family endoribonuclease [Bacteroidota bacterium]
MVRSMTGFGRAEGSIGRKTFLIDIKSLNGKQFDLQLRLPALLKPQEFEIRRRLSEGLVRGSVECTISLKETGEAKPFSINTELAKAYYQPLADLATSLQLESKDLLGILVKMPEVIVPSSEMLEGTEWESFQTLLSSAIQSLNAHRENEGAMLQADLLQRIDRIESLQTTVQTMEPRRKEKIREGLIKILEEEVGKEKYDANRMEQELIYYIEKIDITEEQTRLANHCQYFRSLFQDTDPSKGKKLSFVLQEIGREINTTGAKAYDAEIQRCVVEMKDELEKAKEQILNLL